MIDDVTNPVADDEVIPAEVAAETAAETELETEDGVTIDPVEEEVEVERDGKKYRIPKALEKELLMQSDYTKKTQTVAEERKAVEAMKAQAEEYVKQSQTFIEDVATLRSIHNQITQYEKLDWNTLEQTNPQEAGRLFRQYTMLKGQRDDLGRDLDARQRQRQLEEQQETAKRIEQGRAKLAERIPNWSQETASKLVEFGAKEFGFSTEELSGIVDPRAVETLHWAKIGKELWNKQKAAASKPQQPEPVVVPTVAAKRAAPTTNLYAIKDPEKWAEVRNKQEAARRRR